MLEELDELHAEAPMLNLPGWVLVGGMLVPVLAGETLSVVDGVL